MDPGPHRRPFLSQRKLHSQRAEKKAPSLLAQEQFPPSCFSVMSLRPLRALPGSLRSPICHPDSRGLWKSRVHEVDSSQWPHSRGHGQDHCGVHFGVQMWFRVLCSLPVGVSRCLCTPGWQSLAEVEFCRILVYLGVSAGMRGWGEAGPPPRS